MSDLRPEAWLFDDVSSDRSIAALFKKKEAVTDIMVWIQCYCSLVSVLAEKYPQHIQHFLSYLTHIVRCYKKSRALEWVAYDVAYRRKAPCLKHLNCMGHDRPKLVSHMVHWSG